MFFLLTVLPCLLFSGHRLCYQEYIDKHRKLIPTEFKFKGKSNWDSTIPTNARVSQDRPDWRIAGPLHDPKGTVSFFRCPTCTHVESSWCKPFQHADLDILMKCSGCHKKSKVSVWKCECDRYWQRCHLHRRSSESRGLTCAKLKARKQIVVETDSRKKARPPAQVGPESHEWLLAQDVEREKRKREAVEGWDRHPTIELGYPTTDILNSAFLGPFLKRRFLDDNSKHDI